jgi:predicted dehydrogenase
MTRSLVIGYGSIGARHTKTLQEIGCETAVLTRRQVPDNRCFGTLQEALGAFEPDYVVVANETSEHLRMLSHLDESGFKGLVLVEKPLGTDARLPFSSYGFQHVAVGYNLRLHPVLVDLRRHLHGQDIVSAQIYAGQYLPDWRPGSDFRKSYSAHRDRGGGVLRDLSHELDYILWIFGPWLRLTALGGNFNVLRIASDESWSVLAETERARMVSLQLNYYNRPAERRILVNTHEHSYIADLVSATLQVDGQVTAYHVSRDDTYVSQHRSMLTGNTQNLCTIEHAYRVLGMIEGIEAAAATRCWIQS